MCEKIWWVVRRGISLWYHSITTKNKRHENEYRVRQV